MHGTNVKSYSLTLTSALDVGGWSPPRPCRFTPRERDRAPIEKETLLAPGPVWTGAENLANHRNWIPRLSSL